MMSSTTINFQLFGPTILIGAIAARNSSSETLGRVVEQTIGKPSRSGHTGDSTGYISSTSSWIRTLFFQHLPLIKGAVHAPIVSWT